MKPGPWCSASRTTSPQRRKQPNRYRSPSDERHKRSRGDQQFLEEQLSTLVEGPGPGTGPVTLVGVVHHAHSGEVVLHSISAKQGGPAWGKPEAMSDAIDSITRRYSIGIAGGGGTAIFPQYLPRGRQANRCPPIRPGRGTQHCGCKRVARDRAAERHGRDPTSPTVGRDRPSGGLTKRYGRYSNDGHNAQRAARRGRRGPHRKS